MLGLAEDDPVVVEALEAQAIADKEARAKLRVARTLGDHLESGAKDPFANLEAGYAPRGDGTRRAGNTMTAPSSRPSASSMRRRVAGDRRLARRCGLGTPTRWRPPRCGVVPRVAE